MNEKELIALAADALALIKQKNLKLAVAESCTGGMLSKIITDVSGASAVYLGGVCSYSNEVKMKILGVKAETLCEHGAVSEETARQMSQGVADALGADIGIGITGLAGPLTDGTDKPVGLIYISITCAGNTRVIRLLNSFTDNIRELNRFSAVENALKLIPEAINEI